MLHERTESLRNGGLPDSLEAELPGGANLAGAVAEVRRALGELPDHPGVRGVLHGDAEVDNVVRTPFGLVFVDTDDVHIGWFSADVAFALRAWAPPGGAPDPHDEVPANFLAGYRERRQITDEELSWMPLLARASALETLARLQPVLTCPAEPGWPEWAVELDGKVRARAAQLEEVLLGGAREHR